VTVSPAVVAIALVGWRWFASGRAGTARWATSNRLAFAAAPGVCRRREVARKEVRQMIDPVVGLDFVRAHPERVVLADVRYYLDGRSGRAAYEGGHLPGAIFVDLDTDLAAHAAGRGAASAAVARGVRRRMAALGLSDDTS
jgi:rhodanese-related sulfurtransferase